MHRTRSLVAVVAGALLVLGSGDPARSTEPQNGGSQVVEGAKKVGQGVEETAKGIGKTVSEHAKKAGEEARPIPDRLHDGAKAFGEAIWDAMKSIGRSVQRMFTGSAQQTTASKPGAAP